MLVCVPDFKTWPTFYPKIPGKTTETVLRFLRKTKSVNKEFFSKNYFLYIQQTLPYVWTSRSKPIPWFYRILSSKNAWLKYRSNCEFPEEKHKKKKKRKKKKVKTFTQGKGKVQRKTQKKKKKRKKEKEKKTTKKKKDTKITHGTWYVAKLYCARKVCLFSLYFVWVAIPAILVFSFQHIFPSFGSPMFPLCDLIAEIPCFCILRWCGDRYCRVYLPFFGGIQGLESKWSDCTTGDLGL